MNATPATIEILCAEVGMPVRRQVRFVGACKRRSCAAGYTVLMNEAQVGRRFRVWGGGVPAQWMNTKTTQISVDCTCGRQVTLRRVSAAKTDHVCDSRCTSAKGHSCECSCGGANHGMGNAVIPVGKNRPALSGRIPR